MFRPRPEDRLRAAAARQRRHPVRARGAQRRGAISVDQFLDLNEKIGGFDADANHRAAAHRRRPDRDARGVPDRPPDQRRRRARVDADHRLPRLQRRAARRRHPRALPLVLDARAPGQGERRHRQPRDARRTTTASASTATTARCCAKRSSRWTAGSPRSGRRRATSRRSRRSAEPARRRAGGLLHARRHAGVHRADAAARAGRRRLRAALPPNSFPREVAGADVAADIIKCQLKPIDAATTRSPSARHSGRGCRRSSRRRLRLVASRASSSRIRSARGCSLIRG